MPINLGEIITSHLIVSLCSWLIAMIAGGSFGYLLARLLRNGIRHSPNLLRLLPLIPWRSVAACISLYATTYPLIVMKFGIGTRSGIFTLGIVAGVWSVPVMAQSFLGSWYPTDIPERIISSARWIAIVTIAIAATMATFGGTGYLIYRGNQEVDFKTLFLGIELTGVILVVVDLLLGFIQLEISRLSKRRTTAQTSG